VIDRAILHGSTVLYIPHGSDESQKPILLNFLEKHFISHMVQMKVTDTWRNSPYTWCFISHMVQMKEASSEGKTVINLFLYIPHGSDESL